MEIGNLRMVWIVMWHEKWLGGSSKIKYKGIVSSDNSAFRYKAKRIASGDMNIYLHTKYWTQIYPQ